MIKRILGAYQRRKNMIQYCRSLGMVVGERSRICSDVNIGTEPYLIEIGDHCEITGNVNLVTHDGGVWVFREQHPNWDVMGRIIINDNVYIGYGATVMPGVTINSNSVIGAASVVTKDVPPNVVVAGVPARIIKNLAEYYEKCSRVSIETKSLNYEDKKAVVLRSLDVLNYD